MTKGEEDERKSGVLERDRAPNEGVNASKAPFVLETVVSVFPSSPHPLLFLPGSTPPESLRDDVEDMGRDPASVNEGAWEHAWGNFVPDDQTATLEEQRAARSRQQMKQEAIDSAVAQRLQSEFNSTSTSASSSSSPASASSSSSSSSFSAKLEPQRRKGPDPLLPAVEDSDDMLHNFSETIRATLDAQELMARGRQRHKGIWAVDAANLHPDLVPNADFSRGIYDHDVFEARCSSTKKTVEICRLGMGRAAAQFVYSVPRARANKALKLLHPAHVQATIRTPCGCRHACNTKFSEADILRKRVWYLSLANELKARSGPVPRSHAHLHTHTHTHTLSHTLI
jgi:hypothetical protein